MANFKYFTKVAALLIAGVLLVSSCSKKLPAETLHPDVPVQSEETTLIEETEVAETTETVPEETEPEETEPAHGPFSTAVVTDKVVEINGHLSVKDGTLVNVAGEPIQLKGMSTYGMHAIGIVFNEAFVQTLAEDWGCSVIRLAMYTIGDGGDAYINQPEKYFQMMCDCIDLCIAQDVYCIVDWHILGEGDPTLRQDEAIDFFSRISALYGDCPNVIYEICNEPNGEGVDWDNCIKPYAEAVIPAIRENDPDNIIIVGTPNWSQFVDEAAKNPLEGDNIMYTLHFYAASHGQENRDRVIEALDKNLPIFCTEWGSTCDSGGGHVDTEASDIWLAFLAENNISWCNWSIGGPTPEMSNALKWASDYLTREEKYQGHWPDEFITTSGLYAKSQILGIEYVPAT